MAQAKKRAKDKGGANARDNVPPDQNEILEQSRRAAVQTVANLLDGMAKTKKLRRRFESTQDDDRERAEQDDAPENRDSDFLFDMLRLNATYLNEVARLGARYRDFAYRALENMYRITHPGLKNDGADELVFARSAGVQEEWIERSFVVQNDVNPKEKSARIEVPRIWNPETRDWIDVIELSCDDEADLDKVPSHKPEKGDRKAEEARRRAVYNVTLRFGIPQVVTAKAKVEALPKRKIDDDHIKISLRLDERRERVRRVPVVLDGRDPKQKKPGQPRDRKHDAREKY
jgi:hypothetical protein